MSGLLTLEWLLWALGLVLAFPLAAVVLGELVDRLERAGRPSAAVVRGVRNVVLPIAVLFLVVTRMLGMGAEAASTRLILTALWTGLLYVALTAMNVVLFERAEAGSWRARVPKLFLDLARLFMVFLGGALVLSLVWNRNLGGLLAALGVGSIVLGLALQDTLGSLMSGIALLFEKPFAIGDWIKVASYEGEVLEINWRSVRLRTRERDLLVVPNSVLAKETITNTSEPTPLHAERIRIGFGFEVPPNRVKAVLGDVARSIPNVLADPAPKVEVMEFDEDRIRYEAKLYTTNLRAIPRIRSEFTTRAWYAVQRAGLGFPIPVRTVRNVEPGPRDDGARAAACLSSVASFAALDPSERDALAASARILRFAANETALHRGEPCDALCIVVGGEARMTVPTAGGGERELAVLGPGQIFGEGALLKRKPSPVNVRASDDLEVVALDTLALERVLEANAALASELGTLVEARRRAVQRG